jgi:hypothetical protein
MASRAHPAWAPLLALATGMLCPSRALATDVVLPSQLSKEESYEVIATQAALVVTGRVVALRDAIPPRGGPLTTLVTLEPDHVVLGSIPMTALVVHIPDGLGAGRHFAQAALRSGDPRVLVTCIRTGDHWGLFNSPLFVPSGVVPLESIDLHDVERQLLDARVSSSVANVARRSGAIVAGRFEGEWQRKKQGDRSEPFKTFRIDSVLAGGLKPGTSVRVRRTYGRLAELGEVVLFLRSTGEDGAWVEAHPTRAVLPVAPNDRSVAGHPWKEFLRVALEGYDKGRHDDSR